MPSFPPEFVGRCRKSIKHSIKLFSYRLQYKTSTVGKVSESEISVLYRNGSLTHQRYSWDDAVCLRVYRSLGWQFVIEISDGTHVYIVGEVGEIPPNLEEIAKRNGVPVEDIRGVYKPEETL